MAASAATTEKQLRVVFVAQIPSPVPYAFFEQFESILIGDTFLKSQNFHIVKRFWNSLGDSMRDETFATVILLILNPESDEIQRTIEWAINNGVQRVVPIAFQSTEDFESDERKELHVNVAPEFHDKVIMKSDNTLFSFTYIPDETKGYSTGKYLSMDVNAMNHYRNLLTKLLVSTPLTRVMSDLPTSMVSAGEERVFTRRLGFIGVGALDAMVLCHKALCEYILRDSSIKLILNSSVSLNDTVETAEALGNLEQYDLLFACFAVNKVRTLSDSDIRNSLKAINSVGAKNILPIFVSTDGSDEAAKLTILDRGNIRFWDFIIFPAGDRPTLLLGMNESPTLSMTYGDAAEENFNALKATVRKHFA